MKVFLKTIIKKNDYNENDILKSKLWNKKFQILLHTVPRFKPF